MTLEQFKSQALAGETLQTMADAYGCTRQYIFQLLHQHGLHDRWQEQAEKRKRNSFSQRKQAKLERWELSERGQLLREAARKIVAHIGSPFALWYVEMHTRGCIIGSPRVMIDRYQHHTSRLRLSMPKTAPKMGPFYYRVLALADTWYAVVLPDGRKMAFAPAKARTIYINADASRPPMPSSIPAIVY